MGSAPGDTLSGAQLLAWIERHGGLSSVHVRPYGEGWAHTLVCNDGSQLTPTPEQGAALLEAMAAQQRSAEA